MKKCIKLTNWVLAGILALFGFSSCEKEPAPEYGSPVPEYGVPHATFKLQKTVANQQSEIVAAADFKLEAQGTDDE